MAAQGVGGGAAAPAQRARVWEDALVPPPVALQRLRRGEALLAHVAAERLRQVVVRLEGEGGTGYSCIPLLWWSTGGLDQEIWSLENTKR